MSDVHALIMALPNPVMLVGLHDRILAQNAAAIALIGTDATGRHYVTALRQPALLDAIETTLQDGSARIARYLGNDGARDTTWDVNVERVTVADGAIAVLNFQDLTPLEEAGQMRRDFVANVSHELRTPLTSMMGFIETLRGPAKDDAAAHDRFLKIMEHEAGRMHHLVEDLLELSRVEAQERIRPSVSVALQPLIQDVLASLRPSAAGHNIELRTDMPADTVEILGERPQLWQMISNLVENAIKYGAKDSAVTVTLGKPHYETTLQQLGVQLRVRDQGDGIAAHHVARLTQRFYRVDSHRSRKVGGTGLGLAIVKHITNRHRGRLRIESTMGEGSEFTVLLPVGTPNLLE